EVKDLKRRFADLVDNVKQNMKNEILSVCIELNGDFNKWNESAELNNLNFRRLFAEELHIPHDAFIISKVERGSVVLFGAVHPPYGKIVLEQLVVKEEQIELLGLSDDEREAGLSVKSVKLGHFGIQVAEHRMNEEWNRIYVNSPAERKTLIALCWSGSIDRGGKPYFCPKAE
ncbi:unnamed protein product, partial [Didymodactylos carnosus]